ncbi:MAG: MATE family efflux transporter [Bacteroidetes bacterium QS_8_64_10]|jgi:putative MATE family efflux protein|nr:MAG: MATE family efflux transporter [Bacteroidetes bacterium QS_8_64_10]
MLKPIRLAIEGIGLLLARLGLIDARRALRTARLAWPRIVTGIARMSRSTVDVAMVGSAVGTSAIAGVGFATPFWALAFMLGGGVAGGTISLVSQHFSAGHSAGVSAAVKVSAVFAAVVTLPLVVLFAATPERLIRLIGSGETAVALGAEYLRIVSVAMPFAAVNLVGSRTLVGAGDAWMPMVLRAGGAAANVALNAVLIFVFDLGVAGAAIGTVLATLGVTGAFLWGLTQGRLPLIGELPVQVETGAPHWNTGTARELGEISAPLALTNLAQLGGQFPLLAIVSLFGPQVVAAFVVALRVRDLLNTPGWGFGLASSSLVGQSLGRGREREAEAYGQDAFRFAVAVYACAAVVVFAFAGPVSTLFVDDAAILPTTEALLRATCVSVVFWGVTNGALGPLRASGDTRWPFYGQMLGLVGFAIPAAYLGATTALGLAGLHLAIILEMAVPAAIIYYRYQSKQWTIISRAYRPAAVE